MHNISKTPYIPGVVQCSYDTGLILGTLVLNFGLKMFLFRSDDFFKFFLTSTSSKVWWMLGRIKGLHDKKYREKVLASFIGWNILQKIIKTFVCWKQYSEGAQKASRYNRDTRPVFDDQLNSRGRLPLGCRPTFAHSFSCKKATCRIDSQHILMFHGKKN